MHLDETPPITPPTTLPPSMYRKCGRYYIAKRDAISKKLVWTALSKDYDEALQQYRVILDNHRHTGCATSTQSEYWLQRLCTRMHERARLGAIKRDLSFDLTRQDVYTLGERCNWSCSVTGIVFRPGRPEGTKRRAFMPSIDRANSAHGYSLDNCRLVCLITNIALADWGEAPFAEMAESYVARQLQIREQTVSNVTNGEARDRFYQQLESMRRQIG